MKVDFVDSAYMRFENGQNLSTVEETIRAMAASGEWG